MAKGDLGIKHGEPPLCVKVTKEVRSYVKGKENIAEWLREAIDEKIERELKGSD